RRELAGEIVLEKPAHPVLVLRVVKQVLLAIGETLVDVTRAARILRAPLGHEARHDAEARTDFFGAGLEEDRAVGGLERFRKQDRGLVHAGPVSVCRPSIGTSNSPISTIKALKKSR